ncbi:hypothetical protein C5613_41515 [Rhodococcus opacus]|uniref:Uncharacterized protein n=1 Tax=Rhodococcus opacus TaxID=37919 RepID=A0A2S8IGV8_RHOOP|nr:hypothetical protein C5613_41515 [Rhodococcus opacus]
MIARLAGDHQDHALRQLQGGKFIHQRSGRVTGIAENGTARSTENTSDMVQAVNDQQDRPDWMIPADHIDHRRQRFTRCGKAGTDLVDALGTRDFQLLDQAPNHDIGENPIIPMLVRHSEPAVVPRYGPLRTQMVRQLFAQPRLPGSRARGDDQGAARFRYCHYGRGDFSKCVRTIDLYRPVNRMTLPHRAEIDDQPEPGQQTLGGHRAIKGSGSLRRLDQ